MNLFEKTGGPAFPVCSTCDHPAVRKQGNQQLCAKHYRIGQMRHSAKRHGKYAPTRAEVEAIWPTNNECRDCGRCMETIGVLNKHLVASLQHYRDGSLGIVCRSCNTRHAFMPGDTYRDMPKDHKFCKACQSVKPLSQFSKDSGRSGQMKVKSKCKTCSDVAVNEWKEKNREPYNEHQRAYRAKRKAAGNPVRSGS